MGNEIEEKGSGLGVIEVRINGRLRLASMGKGYARAEQRTHGEIEVHVRDRAECVGVACQRGGASAEGWFEPTSQPF